MTRHVYDNRMVAHLWANQSQAEARSGNGNFWFRGDTIYSYRTPIARLHAGADGHRVALLTNESLSPTTNGKHITAARRALNYANYFHVPSIGAYGGRRRDTADPDHAGNLAYLCGQYEDERDRLLRLPASVYGPLGQYARECLTRRNTSADAYAQAFGLNIPHPADIEGDVAAIVAAAAARNSPEAKAKRAAARSRDVRAAWLEGAPLPQGSNRFPVAQMGRVQCEQGGALLRLKRGHSATVETSWGATVPLAHAVRAFRFLKAVRASGKAWERNGRVVRVGHFTIDRIEATGHFAAGCHRFYWPEIERFARAIGVADQGASLEALEPNAVAAA